jgi:hypothetical protein
MQTGLEPVIFPINGGRINGDRGWILVTYPCTSDDRKEWSPRRGLAVDLA